MNSAGSSFFNAVNQQCQLASVPRGRTDIGSAPIINRNQSNGPTRLTLVECVAPHLQHEFGRLEKMEEPHEQPD
jgi:hypothetical protein